MANQKRFSLTNTFLVYVSIGSLIITILILSISYYFLNRMTRNELQNITDQYMIALVEILKDPIEENDLGVIYNIGESFHNNPYINAMTVYNSRNELIYGFDKNLPGEEFVKVETLESNQTLVGSIELIVSNNAFQRQNTYIYEITIIILVINLGLNLVTVFWITKRYILRPLEKFQEYLTSYLEKGNLPERSSKYTEFHAFQELFLEMHDQIQNQIAEKKYAEEKYQDIFINASIGIFQSSVDGRLISINPALAHMLGYRSPDEALDSINSISQQVYANAEDRNTFLSLANNYIGHIEFEVPLRKKGGAIWQAKLIFRAVRQPDTEEIAYLEGFIEDISRQKEAEEKLRLYQTELEATVQERTAALTERNAALQHEINERKQTEKALRESEMRYRMLADHVNDVIWTMDLDGNFTYVSPSVFRLRGYTPEEVLQQPLEEALTPKSAEIVKKELGKIIKNYQQGNLHELNDRHELEQPCKNGSTVWTEVTTTLMFDDQQNFSGILGVTRDITERRRADQKLRRMAVSDPLTGLYNRRHFFTLAKKEMQRVERYGHSVSLLMFDVDHFKDVNDSFGHQSGDSALLMVAKAAQSCIRKVDILARFGGEEFIILLPETRPEQTLQLAERLQQTIRQESLTFDNTEVKVTISIGIASNDTQIHLTLDQLINHADQALYRAKNAGRDQIWFFK